jgi:hypothetical protein
MMQRRCTMLAGLSLLAVPASAQTDSTFPRQGERIRVTAPERQLTRLTGTLVGMQADSLVVATAAAQLSIPRRLVTRLEVSRGQRSAAGKGALIGLATALGVVGVVGYTACSAATSPRSCFASQEGAQYIFLATWAASGATGALVGALIGGGVRRERWEAVPLVGPAGSGAGFPGLLIGLRVARPRGSD